MTADEHLSAMPHEQLTEAVRLVSGPAQHPSLEDLIRGIEHLEALSEVTANLDQDTRRRIDATRVLYVRKLIASLGTDDGLAARAQLDRAALLLTRLKPELDHMRSSHRRNAALLPTPPNGARAEITPPGLAWSPVPGARGYRVEIRDEAERTIHRCTVAENVHLPPEVLAPGAYSWNVSAVDGRGESLGDRGWSTFTVPAGVPELPWVEAEVLLARLPRGHPRFLYLRSELPQLRASLDTTRRRSWAACRAAAERARGTSPPEYPSYHGSGDDTQAHLRYRAYCVRLRDVVEGAMMDLALAFLMTEDESYAADAKRILLALTEWPTADDDVTSVRSGWGDEPGLIVARSAHRAYDWLFGALDERERSRVRTMCEARADQALRRLRATDYLAHPGESHGARLVAYLVEMAIVMPHAAGAPDWLDFSLKALTTVYPHWGGVDGGWAEGISYGQSYGRIHLPALDCLRETTGFDLWSRPFFTKSREFFLYCSSPLGEFSPFGDGAEKGGPGQDKTAAFGMFMRHQAHRFEDPHVGWWVDQLPEFTPSGQDALLFEDALPIREPTDLPNAKVFRGVGWAALHSDLARPESDTLLLFKSSPYGSVSHSHADQNSFAVLKGGAALAIPSGHYGPLAGMPHHTEWTCSTRAGNTVLVDGDGQPVRERTAAGRVTEFWDDADVSYVAGDAGGAYAGRLVRFVRHILFLRPGLVLMLDDLEAPQPARFQWLLHTLDEMEIDDERGRVVSRRTGATMDVRLQSSEDLRFAQTEDFAVPYNAGVPESFHEEVPNHWHLTAETAHRATSTRIGAVIAVSGPDERLELEQLTHPGWLGARASGPFGAVEGWIQLRAGSPGPEGENRLVAEGRAILGGTTTSGAPVAVGNE